MDSSKRIINSLHTVSVDHSTGQVLNDTKIVQFRIPSEPPYVKLYIDDLSRLMDLKGHHKEMLLELIRKMDYENIITLTPSARSRLALRLKIKEQTFRNYLNDLIKSDVLRRIGHNEFMANPDLFARGEWQSIYERRQAFSMTITYQNGKRSIKTEAIQEQEELELGVDQ